MRVINKIIVHCSASDNPSQDSIEAIKDLHTGDPKEKIQWGIYATNKRGWSDIGYHYFISKDGILHYGRPLDQAGAHCYGHNSNSIGICISGDKIFNRKQFLILNQILRELIIQFGLTENDIHFHRDFDKNKSCPNFSKSEINVSLD